MKARTMLVNSLALALAGATGLALLFGGAGLAQAESYDLRAATTSLTMPDGRVVPMWGFGLAGQPVSVPGPALVVTDGTLTINLANELPVPVSIVIPGLNAALQPVRSGIRAQSFTAQAPAASGGTPGRASFSWPVVRPGTFLYHSGSHPQVQVPLGLYGAVTRDAAAGQAYPGVAFGQQELLLFSELDPTLNEAVARVGGNPALSVTNPLDYRAEYFLINGRPFPAAEPLVVTQGNPLLLRLINAGLRQHVPQLQGGYFTVVAEDGWPLRYAREQYSTLLPAGKTIDVLLTPGRTGQFALFDRALALSNGAASGGGAMTYLQVDPAPPAGPAPSPALSGKPVAVSDQAATRVGRPTKIVVLRNDRTPAKSAVRVEVVRPPRRGGKVTVQQDGTVLFTPRAHFSGTEEFSYRILSLGRTGKLASNPAVVRVAVRK